MIKLTAQDKFIDTKEMEHLFTQGEKCSDIIHLVLDAKNNDVDIKDCVFVLRTVASEGSMTETILPKTIMNEQILLMWKVPYTATAVPGMLRLELIGTKSEETIIKFKMPPIYVKDAVMGSNVPVPDVVDEKLLQMSEMIKNALDIENKLSGESGIFKEIIDARKGTLDIYNYDSLSQRLESEFNLCVQRSFLEMALKAAIEEANDVGVGRFWKNEYGESRGEIFNDYENNVASGKFSHAEGHETAASGQNSHSEGFLAKARGIASHAEGNCTLAWASHSHAEGEGTIVRGTNSHSEGLYTIAESDNQHVGGKYNISDSSNRYVYIIGNGKGAGERANALTLDWNGNLWLSGDVTATDTDGQEISLSALKSELSQTEINVMNVVKNQNNLIQSNNAEHSILYDSLGMQKKNWFKNTHSVGATTINGITFTTNADGSVTANGTATSDASYNMVVALPPNTSFILSGCPSGGSTSTYNIFAIETDSFTQAYRDTGNGAAFNTGSYTEWSFRIRVVNGQTVNDLTFYPMVRSAAVSDSEYAPYTDDLQTQINELRAQIAALTGAAIVSELQGDEVQ